MARIYNWLPFTTTPVIGTATYPEDIDTRNTEMESRMALLDNIAGEVDTAATDVYDQYVLVMNQAVDGGYSQAYIDANFADINGNALETFLVANATTDNQAMAYGQLSEVIAKTSITLPDSSTGGLYSVKLLDITLTGNYASTTQIIELTDRFSSILIFITAEGDSTGVVWQSASVLVSGFLRSGYSVQAKVTGTRLEVVYNAGQSDTTFEYRVLQSRYTASNAPIFGTAWILTPTDYSINAIKYIDDTNAQDINAIKNFLKGLTFGGGGTLSAWDATNTDIDALIGGSALGTIIKGGTSGHAVVGIDSNDLSDGFHIISKELGNPTYTKLCMTVDAAGNASIAGVLNIAGNVAYNAGNSNKSNVNWTCSALTATSATVGGNKVMTSDVIYDALGAGGYLGTFPTALANGLYLVEVFTSTVDNAYTMFLSHTTAKECTQRMIVGASGNHYSIFTNAGLNTLTAQFYNGTAYVSVYIKKIIRLGDNIE